MVDGTPQNGAQLVANREVCIQNKNRKHVNECEEDLMKEFDKLPSFGIVSTGRAWMFLCYEKKDGDWMLQQSDVHNLPLCFIKEGISTLLGIVAGLLAAPKIVVNAFDEKITVVSKKSKTSTTTVTY